MTRFGIFASLPRQVYDPVGLLIVCLKAFGTLRTLSVWFYRVHIHSQAKPSC
jgi:hypothetical protein